MSSTDGFRTLAEHVQEAIARYDRACCCTYSNPAHERATGIPAERLLGKTPTEFAAAHPAASAMALALHAKLLAVMATGEPRHLDLAWHDEAGRARCFALRAIPEFDGSGQVTGVLTLARDIAAERSSERQLSLLQRALDQLNKAFYLMDEEANLIHVNAAACQALGYERDELLGMSFFDIAPDFPPASLDEQRPADFSAPSHSRQARQRDKAGRLSPVAMHLTRFELDGRPYRLALAHASGAHQGSDEELQRREQEFRTLVENSPDTIARYDREGRRLYVNAAFLKNTGKAATELLGQYPIDYTSTPNARAYQEALRAVAASGKSQEVEYVWPAHDGRMITSDFRLVPEFGPDGEVASVLAVGRDISAFKESERRLQKAEAMARIGHWQWDYVREEAQMSPEACRMFGHEPGWKPHLEEVIALIVDEDRERVRTAFQDAYGRGESELAYTYRIKADGEMRYSHTHAHIEYRPDGLPHRLIGTTQDISELKNYESHLYELAFHDTITGLPNRALLNDRLRQALTEAARRGQVLGLLMLDLDRFKEINDTHGHGVGDRLLYESAQRLSSLVRDYDTVARLGGDEFAIVLPEVREAADLGSVARKILDSLAAPFHIGGQDLFISASIGIAVFPSDGSSADALLQYADLALYDAKERGRAGFRFYASELTAKSRNRASIETALRRAEPDGELELYYQPKIDLVDGQLVGAEALLRWHHPTIGLVSPDKFIGIAEDSGLIVGMGTWVLTKACLAAQRWNERSDRELKIAVNLSSRQFRDDDLVATVRSVLALTGCEARWLELEITESLLLDDSDKVRATLQAFRDMGISIAMDDFGTGYSALGYLKRFPIDVLKIDRSFTHDLTIEHDSTELVKAIITMARSLRLDLVAEGIETDAQESFLQAHGCHLGQGYRYGKPMPRGEFEERLLAPLRPRQER